MFPLAFLSVMTKCVSTLESYEKEGDSRIRKRSKHYIYIHKLSIRNEKILLVGYIKC